MTLPGGGFLASKSSCGRPKQTKLARLIPMTKGSSGRPTFPWAPTRCASTIPGLHPTCIPELISTWAQPYTWISSFQRPASQPQ